MKGNAADVFIDSNITYSLKTNSFNKPLKLVNHSTHIYVFKVFIVLSRSKQIKKLLFLYSSLMISCFLIPQGRLL